VFLFLKRNVIYFFFFFAAFFFGAAFFAAFFFAMGILFWTSLIKNKQRRLIRNYLYFYFTTFLKNMQAKMQKK
jgi:hypothetical protein